MRSLNNKTPKVTVPERIWAAPPYDDPGWETGAGEWDVSENWAAEGKECFIRINLHQAEVAAAYERAAEMCDRYPYVEGVKTAIRALATPDQTAALDRLIADAVRPYVALLTRWQGLGCPNCNGDCSHANPPIYSCIMQETSKAILAASKKGGA